MTESRIERKNKEQKGNNQRDRMGGFGCSL
jgi:hypothetical protein